MLGPELWASSAFPLQGWPAHPDVPGWLQPAIQMGHGISPLPKDRPDGWAVRWQSLLKTPLSNVASPASVLTVSAPQYTFTPWPGDDEIFTEYVHLLNVYSVACTSFKCVLGQFYLSHLRRQRTYLLNALCMMPSTSPGVDTIQ